MVAAGYNGAPSLTQHLNFPQQPSFGQQPWAAGLAAAAGSAPPGAHPGAWSEYLFRMDDPANLNRRMPPGLEASLATAAEWSPASAWDASAAPSWLILSACSGRSSRQVCHSQPPAGQSLYAYANQTALLSCASIPQTRCSTHALTLAKTPVSACRARDRRRLAQAARCRRLRRELLTQQSGWQQDCCLPGAGRHRRQWASAPSRRCTIAPRCPRTLRRISTPIRPCPPLRWVSHTTCSLPPLYLAAWICRTLNSCSQAAQPAAPTACSD